MERSLAGRTLFITGASRGIGRAIALRAARDGANVAVVAKTSEPHPKLPGTIHTVAAEIEAAGGQALALATDVRDAQAIEAAARATAERFGGIDILVNNASAIYLAGTVDTPARRFDLMHDINARGSFLCGRACIPYLKQSAHAHILSLSPPLAMEARWFAHSPAYTAAKYSMSMWILAWAEELREAGVAANALWPRTTIDTAAVRNILGGDEMARRSRTPEIVAEAAWWILTEAAGAYTGNFVLDEQVLADHGVSDLSHYAVDASMQPMPDFYTEGFSYGGSNE